MGIRGVGTLLALLAACVAVGAVRDLASYSSSLDYTHSALLDFEGESRIISGGGALLKAKKVVFYDPVKKIVRKVPKKPACEEGKVIVKTAEGILKCVNKEKEVIVEVEKPECLEGETLEKGPEGKLICVFKCEKGYKPEKTEEGLVCVVSCPKGLTAVEGACVFVCPEGFKQIGDTEECEEDVPVVESVTVPEEEPVVEEDPVVEAVTVPEEVAPTPLAAPVEPIPEIPEVPIVEEPVVEEPVPEVPVVEEPVPEVPVVEEPVPEVPVVEEPVPEVPVVEEPIPEVPVVEEPVPEVPVVVEEPVPEPEVAVQTVPEEGPGTCPAGFFYMDKVEAQGCQACDGNCDEEGCKDFVGCGVCKPGYYTERFDVDWPFTCVKCEIAGCSKCKDGITLELGEKAECEVQG